MWLSANVQERPLKEAPTVLFIDEMESIEHTKLKPLTLPLAVGDDYRIYAMTVGRIQAKGPLAELSRKKYGRRVSEKRLALERLFKSLQFRTAPRIIRTDKSPFYKEFVKKYFPNSTHETFSSRELVRKKKEMLFLNQEKKLFDPLFPLNQRCAMLRHNIKRLARRSWCTTKRPDRLETVLKIYLASQTTR